MLNRGFTLVELMVSITIFSLIVGATAGIFISSSRTQRQALISREALDNLSYTLEYMSRSLRMANKDLDGGCLGVGYNYLSTHNGHGIKFLNYNNECQEFFLDTSDKRLKESKNGAAPLPLTSEGLTIKSCNFSLSGERQDDNLQPRVTIALGIEIEGFKTNIQTTVSQRNLDVQY